MSHEGLATLTTSSVSMAPSELLLSTVGEASMDASWGGRGEGEITENYKGIQRDYKVIQRDY